MEDKNEIIEVSLGINSQTAMLIGGLFLIFCVFASGPFWPVSLTGGVVLAAGGLRRLLSIPLDFVNVDAVEEPARQLYEAVKMAKAADKELSKLKGCMESDVTELMFDKWESFTPTEKQQFRYLRDGVNDRRDWMALWQSKRRGAVVQILLASFKIYWWHRMERHVLGLAYDRYVVDATEAADEPAPPPPVRAKDRTHQDISDVFLDFGLTLEPTGKPQKGPTITRYSFVVPAGTKLSKIQGMENDIAMRLGVTSVRIAPDGQGTVGVEVPNITPKQVKFASIIKSDAFQRTTAALPVALGLDITGNLVIGDIAEMHHLLIAGTTGSGKFVCENVLICSLIERCGPERLQFVMIDPKMVELAPYNGLPHLKMPVVTDPKEAADVLRQTVDEMMARYKAFSDCGTKKLVEYNAKAEAQGRGRMPSVVVIVDELADLMMASARAVEEYIVRIAQMGRAAGIHLVIATQRPSADVITGTMKANIPSRIAFAVASNMNSRIVLDGGGAEKLLGKGDMLYLPNGGKLTRVQGPYISETEIGKAVRKWSRTSTG